MNCPHCNKPIPDELIISYRAKQIRSKQKPRTKEQYQEMGRKRWAKVAKQSDK